MAPEAAPYHGDDGRRSRYRYIAAANCANEDRAMRRAQTDSLMRISIFGASRGVGRAAVDAAIAAGHAVTAFSRTAGTLARTEANVITGNVIDRAAVRAALAGSDAVLVALGVTPGQRGSTPHDVCSRGTAAILTEMTDASIERLVVVTSYGVGATRTRRPFVFDLIAKTLLKDIMADKEQQERDVRAFGRRWTIVQPLGLTDGPATGKVYVSTDGSRKTTRVARRDVAAVCIDAIANDRFIGECVAVSAT
jgi:putative NADH-flavin reductase